MKIKSGHSTDQQYVCGFHVYFYTELYRATCRIGFTKAMPDTLLQLQASKFRASIYVYIYI